MKPIQQHTDPRITNISFDNFTGSISIITSISDDDDEDTKEFMLSSSQTNDGSDLFIPNHHLSLITQPVLGARSRNKHKIDSITNSRRSSYNDSPSLILPINRINEKKNNHHESSDSGLDFSLSTTNSSVQYPQQQHITIHRPLSALNEDSNTDDTFYEQPIRFPVVNPGRNRYLENVTNNNTHEQQHHSNLFSDEREKMIKKSNDGTHLDTLSEIHQQPNINKTEYIHPSTQQYRSLNDLTNKILPTPYKVIRKPNTSTLKPLRKKTKLNIIVEPSIPLSSSNLAVHDEQIHSITRITSSSSSQTTSHLIRPINQQIKPKAITPLGHYPNQEQIRAHINRSVIERQHPTYLSIPLKKGIIKQMIPSDASSSKLNNLSFKQQKQPTIIFHQRPTIQGDGLDASTLQNLHIGPSRQIKQLNNEEINDNRQEKRNQKEKKHLNEINKWHENSPKVKDIQEPFKTNQKRRTSQDQIEQTIDQRHFISSIQRQQEKDLSIDKKRIEEDQIETFLTSTPRRYYEHHNQSNGSTLKGQNINNKNRRQQPIDSKYKSKPTGLINRNKNRVINPNIDIESGYSPRNTITPFQSHPIKLIRIPNIQHQTEQNHQRKKSPIGSINNLFQTNRIQPRNTNNIRRKNELNRLNNTSKMSLTQKNSNRLFQPRSPTSWSIISDHQNNQEQYHLNELSSSSSSPHNELINNKSTDTYQFIVTDEQQPLDGRYVIPSNNSQLSSYIVSPSQTSSHHTHPFICTPDSNNINHDIINNSPRELPTPDNTKNRSSSSSSLDRFSPNDRFPLPLGKVTVAMEEDDISTNYDSDDGWSNDSAELIYVDEHYITQKKKITSSSSSHLISQQHSHLQAQQQNVLLQ